MDGPTREVALLVPVAAGASATATSCAKSTPGEIRSILWIDAESRPPCCLRFWHACQHTYVMVLAGHSEGSVSQPHGTLTSIDILAMHASTHPDRPAVVGLDRVQTYAQLIRRASKLARSLYGLGLRPGDRVAIMAYNFPQYAEASAAAARLRAGLVAVPYQMVPSEIEYIVNHSGATALIFWHEFADRIVPHRNRYKAVLPQGLISFGGPPAAGAVDYEGLFASPPDVDLESLASAEQVPAFMAYTSGTTGRPKGAARNAGLLGQEDSLQYLLELTQLLKLASDEVHLVCCPLYHSAPYLFAAVTALLGGTRVLQPRFDAAQFFQLVEKHRVTSTHVVPTMITRMLRVPKEFTDGLNLSSLRTVICGAAPLFPEDKLAFLDRFGPILHEYYGSTESGVNTIITPEEIRQRPTSIGKPFAGNELKIYDETGNEAPPGKPGRLYIRSCLMMDGYHRNPEATRATFKGDHLTVGDVAIRDADGYYYIVDRIHDMIIRAGVNIYPAEVERVLNLMPGVAECAVVGKPDAELGEVVAAFVVRAPDAAIGEDDVKTFCTQQMARFKVPAAISFVDVIPRSPSGKTLKKQLRDQLKPT